MIPSDPTDTAPDGLPVKDWFARARALTQAVGAPNVVADLHTLQARTARPAFRVVVLGERGRGKTTLVNRLLGEAVVPLDAATSTPVLVHAAGSGQLEITRSGKVAREELTAEAWATLADQPPDPDSTVRVGVTHALLSDLDLELVDTPGANDVDLQAPESTRVLAAGADAVIMTVSATAALSLTEVQYLTECAVEAKVPHIAVVITRLDTVDDERVAVITHVTDRAQSIGPHVTTIAGPTPNDPDSAAAVVEWLTGAARGGERLKLRTDQMAGQLAALLRGVAQLARAGADAAGLDADARVAATKQAQLGLTDELLGFDELRVELRRRHTSAAARFRTHLAGTRERLVEILRYDLHHNPDPRLWWERDLPYRLRRELVGVTRDYEKSLLGGVHIDLEWFHAELTKRFGISPSGLELTLRGLKTPTVAPAELELENLRNRRIAYRVGPLGLAVLVGMLSSAAVPFASIGATAAGVVVGEVFLRGAIDRQRKTAERHLGDVVDSAVGEFGTAVATALKELYDQLLDEAVRLRQRWYEDRTAALQEPHGSTTDWNGLAAQADQLGDEIDSTIAKIGARA